MIYVVALVLFTVAGLAATTRLLLGPTTVDRIIALDVLLICLMGAIAVEAARTNNATFLVALVVVSIVGFTATVGASRFVDLQNERLQK